MDINIYNFVHLSSLIDTTAGCILFNLLILDSERSDCEVPIDFTMMCVFFLYFFFVVCHHGFWSSKTVLIFFNSILFDGKVNLVGSFERSKFKIPNSF